MYDEDMAEIRREISRLENSKLSYGNLEKLAVLYAVENQHTVSTPRSYPQPTGYSYAGEKQSEFLAAVAGADMSKVLSVLDEHFDAIRVVFPKEYAAVIRRISE